MVTTVQKTSLVLLVILPVLASAQHSSIITGKLLGSDNKPMVMSHVRLAGGVGFSDLDPALEDGEFASAQVRSDGSFEISTDSIGAMSLMFTGVGHAMLKIPLILELPTSLKLDVQLSAFNLTTDFSDAEIRYDFDEVKGGKKGYVKETSPKVYQIQIPSNQKELKYRICEIGGWYWGVSIPCATADAYEYYRDGVYSTIVYPKNGMATIVLDGTQPRLPQLPATLLFSDTESAQARFFTCYQRFQHEMEIHQHALEEYMRGGGKQAHFSYDWTPFRNRINRTALEVRDTIVMDELAIEYLETVLQSKKDRDTSKCREYLRNVSPLSFAWVIHGSAAIHAKEFHPLRGKYVQTLIRTHPSLSLRAYLTYRLCSYAKQQKDHQAYQRLFSELVTQYANTPAGRSASRELRENQGPAIGTRIPSFSFTSLDSSKSVYSDNDFLGKYVLMDFWATWCGPCVAEMKYLHNANSRFHEQGLEILSVSMDASPNHVKYFRSTKWKMPWPNAYVESERQTEITSTFDVQFPKPMLISPTGIIVALGDALRGKNLGKTLAKCLPQK